MCGFGHASLVIVLFLLDGSDAGAAGVDAIISSELSREECSEDELDTTLNESVEELAIVLDGHECCLCLLPLCRPAAC